MSWKSQEDLEEACFVNLVCGAGGRSQTEMNRAEGNTGTIDMFEKQV